jgi:hypothetical protein
MDDGVPHDSLLLMSASLAGLAPLWERKQAFCSGMLYKLLSDMESISKGGGGGASSRLLR